MPAGRPSKYNPNLCQKLIDFFNVEPSMFITEVITFKGGEKESQKAIPNKFPTFEKFAANNDLHVDTLIEWTKQHPEFSEAYKKAKQLQKDFLMQNGLSGLYNAAAFCFVAKNCTDMRDKTEIEHTGLPPVPAAIEIKLV